MGWGDEIMVTGEAVRLGCDRDKPLVVIGKNGQPRWHPLWEGNPRIWRPGSPPPIRYEKVRNHGGWRPYVLYAGPEFRPQLHNQTERIDATHKGRWVFHPTWRATKGELPGVERRKPGKYVVVEPHLKRGIEQTNKQWGWMRWQLLVGLMPGIDFVQLGPPGTKTLKGARLIETASFIEACYWLSGAWGAVLPEGGLHHAAAALDVPAIVLFGGSRSVRSTGYDLHVNLDDPDPETRACGSRRPCAHCEEIWARITPEIVAETLSEMLVV